MAAFGVEPVYVHDDVGRRTIVIKHVDCVFGAAVTLAEQEKLQAWVEEMIEINNKARRLRDDAIDGMHDWAVSKKRRSGHSNWPAVPADSKRSSKKLRPRSSARSSAGSSASPEPPASPATVAEISGPDSSPEP